MPQGKPLDLDRYRKHLTSLRSELEADLQAYQRRDLELAGGPDEPGNRWEHSGYGDHLADDATEVFEREKDLGLEQTLRAHLQQVDQALIRIDAGSYGTCERCGKPIAHARLAVMPEATLCIDCKIALEHQQRAAFASRPAIV